MVNFAELKAKAEKAKEASINKVTNARDRYSSAPSSKGNWDPNWKRAPQTSPPLPPPRRPDVIASTTSIVARTSRHTDLPAPPARVASGYPPSHRESSQDNIDWAKLNAEDKEAFFEWLDEFFSQHLKIELGRERRSVGPPVPRLPDGTGRAPPMVNMTTRPQV